jgi:hypothetical protein
VRRFADPSGIAKEATVVSYSPYPPLAVQSTLHLPDSAWTMRTIARNDITQTPLFPTSTGESQGGDPYDAILQFCQQISGQQPAGVQLNPMETVVLGIYDPTSGFTWDPSVLTKTHVEWEVIPANDGSLKPQHVKETFTDYYVNVTAISITLQVNLVNNPMSVVFNAKGNIAVAAPNATMVTVTGPFSGEVDFAFTAGVPQGGLSVTVNRPHFMQIGCVSVPALPIAIVYQPPVTDGNGEFDTSQSVGAVVTQMGLSSGIAGDSSGSSLEGLDGAILALKEVADSATAAGDEGAAVAAISQFLADALEALGGASDPSGGTSLEVDPYHTVETIFTTENRFYSSSQLGPGTGDVLVYLQDATFAFYNYDGETTIVPLGYRGDGPMAVPASSLMPGAAQPADLPDSARASLLALDPVASGQPNEMATSNRFSYVRDFVQDFALKQDFCWDHTVQATTQTLQLTYSDNGQIVDMTLGQAGESQTRTINTCVSATGPFHFEVWYDNLFGTFAYRDLSHIPSGSMMAYSGTAYFDRAHSQPMSRQAVTLEQNGHRVTTFTDERGRYAARAAWLQPGGADLILPSKDASPHRQSIYIQSQPGTSRFSFSWLAVLTVLFLGIGFLGLVASGSIVPSWSTLQLPTIGIVADVASVAGYCLLWGSTVRDAARRRTWVWVVRLIILFPILIGPVLYSIFGLRKSPGKFAHSADRIASGMLQV